MGVVLKSGTVKPSDAITVRIPELPWEKLDRV